MNIRTRLAGAVVALGVLGTLATVTSGPAEAAIPVLCPILNNVHPAPDPMRITLVNYDFGAGEHVDGEPDSCGTLTWDLTGGTITPRLTGNLYARNAVGTEVRMRLRHRDVDGTLLASSNGAPKQVLSNDVEDNTFAINLGAYSNPAIYQVDVELQQKVAGLWETKGTDTAYIGSAAKADDLVRILATGQDFGDGPFVNGEPDGSGTLTWDLANDTIEPRLRGTLYMTNAAGTRAQMRMTFFDVHGNELGSTTGGLSEPTLNGTRTFAVDFANFPNLYIYSAVVTLEVDVFGTWTPQGNAVTVSI